MVHSFTGALTKFLASVFDYSVFWVLAAVLTGRDYLAICTCLQGGQAGVDSTRLFVSLMHHKKRLSGVPRKGVV
jgi:hypothetical protein